MKPQTAAHELHSQIEAARVLLANYEDILGDDAVARADAVEGETDLREAIRQGLGRVVEIELLETGIKAIQDNLKARAARLGEQKENLRTALMVAMELAALKKLETPLGTIALQSVPPTVVITSEADIPSRFWKAQEPKLDRTALKSALKEGEVVPGAQLDNGSLTVAIRTR